MATKLIKVNKPGTIPVSVQLDTASMLSAVRTTLEATDGATSGIKIMDATDSFISQGSVILTSQEATISLDTLLSGSSSITLGSAAPDDPLSAQDGVQRYNDLSATEKTALFNNIQIFKGLTFGGTEGFGKSFKTVYSWKNGTNPDALLPRILTEVSTVSSYTKVTHSMEDSNVNSGSASLSTPYGGGEAEFKYAQSKATSSSQVTQYVTGKFIVRKVEISIDPAQCVIDPAFEAAIANAVHSPNPDTFQQYYDLLKVLNQYGYYIPKVYTLGGALLSSDSTTINDFSETKTTEQEYGGSFKAAFDGIGGGASYKNAQKNTTTTTTSTKFEVTSFNQIGGKAGTSNDFKNWATSMDKAIYWDVASYDELLPTLVLISDAQVQNKCLNLINKFYSYPNAVELQPNLNMLDYGTKVESLLQSGGSPWGN